MTLIEGTETFPKLESEGTETQQPHRHTHHDIMITKAGAVAGICFKIPFLNIYMVLQHNKWRDSFGLLEEQTK